MLRDDIDQMVLAGVTLEEIEEQLIDHAPVGEDMRAALWLYAWGCIERQRPPLPSAA